MDSRGEQHQPIAQQAINQQPGHDWVMAAPFRAQLRHLMAASGLPWRVIALVAGVPPSWVCHLLHGRNGRPLRRIHPELGRRLLVVTLDQLAAAKVHQVPGAAARLSLRCLLSQGWPMVTLAVRLNSPAPMLHQLVEGTLAHCPELIALQIRAGHGALCRARHDRHCLVENHPPQPRAIPAGQYRIGQQDAEHQESGTGAPDSPITTVAA